MSAKQPTKDRVKTKRHVFISSSVWRWFQIVVVLTILSLVVNHLASRDSFPDSASYRLPVEGFLASIFLSTFIGIIAHLNFKFYKKKYFRIDYRGLKVPIVCFDHRLKTRGYPTRLNTFLDFRNLINTTIMIKATNSTSTKRTTSTTLTLTM